MSILVWLILGLVAGCAANAIMGSSYSIAGDIVVGIIGALLGGYLASVFFGIAVNGINMSSVLIAIIGAMVCIALARTVSRR